MDTTATDEHRPILPVMPLQSTVVYPLAVQTVTVGLPENVATGMALVPTTSTVPEPRKRVSLPAGTA